MTRSVPDEQHKRKCPDRLPSQPPPIAVSRTLHSGLNPDNSPACYPADWPSIPCNNLILSVISMSFVSPTLEGFMLSDQSYLKWWRQVLSSKSNGGPNCYDWPGLCIG